MEKSMFGIICLDKDNQLKPWVNFEAGALSKHVEKSRVVPYVVGFELADIAKGPLTMFQGTLADYKGTQQLLIDINKHLDASHQREVSEINDIFSKFWPELESVINNSIKMIEEKHSGLTETAENSSYEITEKLNEVLENTRILLRRKDHDTPIQEFAPWDFEETSSVLLNTILQQSNINLRAFLKPAKLYFDGNTIIITIESKFHGTHALAKFDELRSIVTKACQQLGLHPAKLEMVTLDATKIALLDNSNL